MVQTATKKAFRRKSNKRNAVHYVNLKQAAEKLETELLFSQRCQTSWLKRPGFHFKEWYSESLQQKRIEKIIFPFGNKVYIQSSLDLKGWTWRRFLRKLIDLKLLYERLLSKNMNSSKLSLVLLTSPSLSTVIAFHRVQKSPLIIGIVDQIKIKE